MCKGKDRCVAGMGKGVRIGGKGFPGDLVVRNPPANAGDMGSLPDLGRPAMLQTNSAPAPQRLNPLAATTEALTP